MWACGAAQYTLFTWLWNAENFPLVDKDILILSEFKT